MADIALVEFTDNSDLQPVKKTGLIKCFVMRTKGTIRNLLFKKGFFRTGLGARLFCFSKRRELEQPNRVLEIAGELQIHVIRLPVPQDRLSEFNCSFLEKIISRDILKSGINLCYIPSKVRDKGYLGSYDKCPGNEKLLLKLLLDKVLCDIYSKKSIRIGDLDIVIAAGDNIREALEVLRLLESQIRYATIAVAQKEPAETAVEEIFGDMGLAVSIVTDCKSVFKSADIVINLADRSFLPNKAKLPAGALVLNCGNCDISKAFPQNTILNGLVPDLPKQDALKLEKRILKYYSKSELAELAIQSILMLSPEQTFDFEAAKTAAWKYEKHGFRIAGFTGRYGVIKIEDLQKLAAASS